MNKDVILHGDVYSCLSFLEDNSISIAITSPPYYKQRDYGFKGQIGQEKTPEEYISKLVKIFSKLREKLKDDGIFFLNIGDKYFSKYGKSHLLQIPYRLAYHMQREGWYLEDILIWYKPNHMPSSVKDRFANTYEPILVFSKSKNNIYKKDLPKFLKIHLQQIKWKHTAAYPEKLVETLFNYVDFDKVELILDPFAGTGTTASVINKIRNNSLFYKHNLHVILIEKFDKYIDIIKERTNIENVIPIKDKIFKFEIIKEEAFPKNITPKIINNNKYGEVYIAETSEEFLSILRGIFTEEFKKFHREDSIYFFGVRKFSLKDLYFVSQIFEYGYILRNMLILTENDKWFPIFMIAKDSKKIEYRFFIDRVRKLPKNFDHRKWDNTNFLGYKVKNNISKNKKNNEGVILDILEKYEDGFPKLVIVQWESFLSTEYVLHPNNDELIMESLEFKCPYCFSKLAEPFDPLEKNICPACNRELWKSSESIPIINEIYNIEIKKDFKNKDVLYFNNITYERNKKINTNSKFISISRINWGASPGARKIINGEFFSKMRLYKINHAISAKYLNILRKERGLSIKEITEKFPPEYKHTVSHWFRTDMGGCIPLPEDIEQLKEIFNLKKDPLLDALKKTVLKFQTVKHSAKGKNPGDFIENKDFYELIDYLQKLYKPLQKLGVSK